MAGGTDMDLDHARPEGIVVSETDPVSGTALVHLDKATPGTNEPSVRFSQVQPAERRREAPQVTAPSQATRR